MKKSKQEKASEGKDGADIISNLPDPILHLILSQIPTTEEVVRTSILSTRWRYLWTSVPAVDIDYYQGGMKAPQKFTKDNFKKFVDRVLVNKPLYLESFRLCCGDNYSMATVEVWIDAAVGRKVKLLDLKFGLHEYEDHIMELPRCLVTGGSLEVLKLSLFGHGLIVPHFTGFLALRALKLKICFLLNTNSVKDFLESYPLLEDLSLVNCVTYLLPVFCISCPKLKKLEIDNGEINDSKDLWCGEGDLCNSLEICCPNLVYLELVGRVAEEEFIFESLDSLKEAVIHHPDNNEDYDPEDELKVCELLSGISHVESLSLHLCFTNKSINLEDLPKSFPNLKTLELNMTSDAFNMSLVIRILICSPNIESLHLVIKQDLSCSSSTTEVPDVDFPSGHIFEQLKTVKMIGGITAAVHEIGFIKFLLGSAPALETMTINPNMNLTDDKLRF